MGGPHDGLVLHWLSNNSELDLESLNPARLLAGLIDMLAAILDTGGPEDVIARPGGIETTTPEGIRGSVSIRAGPGGPALLDLRLAACSRGLEDPYVPRLELERQLGLRFVGQHVVQVQRSRDGRRGP
jgi:hypothetical protein